MGMAVGMALTTVGGGWLSGSDESPCQAGLGHPGYVALTPVSPSAKWTVVAENSGLQQASRARAPASLAKWGSVLCPQKQFRTATPRTSLILCLSPQTCCLGSHADRPQASGQLWSWGHEIEGSGIFTLGRARLSVALGGTSREVPQTSGLLAGFSGHICSAQIPGGAPRGWGAHPPHTHTGRQGRVPGQDVGIKAQTCGSW